MSYTQNTGTPFDHAGIWKIEPVPHGSRYAVFIDGVEQLPHMTFCALTEAMDMPTVAAIAALQCGEWCGLGSVEIRRIV